MNYYIQGNKDKADQIKASFEAKGCVMHTGIQCDLSDMVYFSLNGKVGCMKLRNLDLFKTHPDYKELELPVEPKFKDGDVLVTTKIRSCPFIYRKTNYNNNLAYYYAGIDGNGDFCEGCLKKTLYHFGSVSDVIPATKKQRDLLFAKMKEAGYEWDANKKKLRKIKPHYDISNFKPFDKVLARDTENEKWVASLFSNLENCAFPHKFVCIDTCYTQCIPFNDDTKHLLGTTDMCDECYINW